MSASSAMRPDAVLFDCDGVLVDSEPITERVMAANFARHGWDVPLEQVHTLFVGGTMKGAGEEAARRGAILPDTWLEDIYADIYAALRAGTPPIQGVHALLDKLDAAGIPYAVGSNGEMEKMEITLGQTGLLERFDGRLVSAHELGIAKPDPAVYLEAARLLGVDPARSVVIDDSPSGVRAGVASGARTFGFAEHSNCTKLATLGAEVVRSMDEVAEVLGL